MEKLDKSIIQFIANSQDDSIQLAKDIILEIKNYTNEPGINIHDVSQKLSEIIQILNQ